MKIPKVLIIVILFSALSGCSIALNLAVSGPSADGFRQYASSSWLSGWEYRKAHNITGSSAGVQVNYQIMIIVHFNNGLDTDGEVYLSGKCRTDFGDIRFTDPSGNSLDYWIRQKTDSVHALFWIKVDYIPQSPDYATIYLYYGNANATTTSNKDWVFPVCTDFEDGTAQGWGISWVSYTYLNGTSTSAYEGTYAREAARIYGPNYAGTGHFYDGYKRSLYLAAGSYRMEGAARFGSIHYTVPIEIKYIAGETTFCSASTPDVSWHWLSGNFSLGTSQYIQLNVQFHLRVDPGFNEGELYYIDSVLLRKWCSPEPTHGLWGEEATSNDTTPPQITSVQWIPTCPYPLVLSSTPRQGEPIEVRANVIEEAEGSGINYVRLIYRADADLWQNATMSYNSTLGLWTTILPGQRGNATVEFYITASDNAGNLAASYLHSFSVKALITGDINGDGAVTILDVVLCTANYGKTQP
jgi:hypothetical protein